MKIKNYQFGKIEIDGRTYKNDLAIFSDHIEKNWWRDKGHLLQVQDLEKVWREKPEKLIIGQGAYGLMKIDRQVENKCKKMGIKLIARRSDKACQEYNSSNKENTVLAIHLTC